MWQPLWGDTGIRIEKDILTYCYPATSSKMKYLYMKERGS